MKNEKCTIWKCDIQHGGEPQQRGQFGQIYRSTTFSVVFTQERFPIDEGFFLYCPEITVFRIEGKPVPNFRIAVVASGLA